MYFFAAFARQPLSRMILATRHIEVARGVYRNATRFFELGVVVRSIAASCALRRASNCRYMSIRRNFADHKVVPIRDEQGQIARWFGFWPALLIAPLLAGAIGAGVERFGLRRVHKNGHVAELLFTFGLAFAIEEVVQIIWGKSPVDFRVPPLLDFPAFTIFSTNWPSIIS